MLNAQLYPFVCHTLARSRRDDFRSNYISLFQQVDLEHYYNLNKTQKYTLGQETTDEQGTNFKEMLFKYVNETNIKPNKTLNMH